MAIIARECLANGLLVKPTHEIDLKSYCSSEEEVQKRVSQLEALRAQAQEAGVSGTTLALNYVSQLEGVSVALIGARSVEQLQSLLAQRSV